MGFKLNYAFRKSNYWYIQIKSLVTKWLKLLILTSTVTIVTIHHVMDCLNAYISTDFIDELI